MLARAYTQKRFSATMSSFTAQWRLMRAPSALCARNARKKRRALRPLERSRLRALSVARKDLRRARAVFLTTTMRQPRTSGQGGGKLKRPLSASARFTIAKTSLARKGEKMSDVEIRLTRLEELSFFQEEQLKELNAALTAQQEQLDRLEQQMSDALVLLRLLRDKLADQPENAPPPHFMPERY